MKNGGNITISSVPTAVWGTNHQPLKFLNQTSDKIWYAIYELTKWYKNSRLVTDLDEDINVIRKDLVFSHYYNPKKKLADLIRYDLSVRVKVLSREMEIESNIFGKNNDLALINLGRLVHHIQDMAAPPHVVPISHGLSDGF